MPPFPAPLRTLSSSTTHSYWAQMLPHTCNPLAISAKQLGGVWSRRRRYTHGVNFLSTSTLVLISARQTHLASTCGRELRPPPTWLPRLVTEKPSSPMSYLPHSHWILYPTLNHRCLIQQSHEVEPDNRFTFDPTSSVLTSKHIHTALSSCLPHLLETRSLGICLQKL
jgi:hypothetical protein